MSPQAEQPQALYDLATTFEPINLVVAAALMLFVAYKIIPHPSGLDSGFDAALEGCVWLMFRFVGLVEDVCGAVERDLDRMV